MYQFILLMSSSSYYYLLLFPTILHQYQLSSHLINCTYSTLKYLLTPCFHLTHILILYLFISFVRKICSIVHLYRWPSWQDVNSFVVFAFGNFFCISVISYFSFCLLMFDVHKIKKSNQKSRGNF